MKFVLVQTQAEAAGAQRVSDLLARGLRELGHDARTVFLYRKTDAYDNDANCDFIRHTPPKSTIAKIGTLPRLRSYLRKNAPDVVITFQHYGNLIGSVAARLAGIPIVIANQNGVPDLVGSRLVTEADRLLGSIGAYSANVVNTRWTAELFDSYPSAYRRHLRLIPHGVDEPGKAMASAKARELFGLPQKLKLLVSVGRLSPEKNHRAILPILRHRPDVALAIAGAGPCRDELESEAGDLGLSDRLYLVGEVDPSRVYSFLATGDAFVFPSAWETFGIAAVEAALSGIPVVCNDLVVMREVLGAVEGARVEFCDFSNLKATAAAVDAVLTERDETARGPTSNPYDASTMTRAYLSLM